MNGPGAKVSLEWSTVRFTLYAMSSRHIMHGRLDTSAVHHA